MSESCDTRSLVVMPFFPTTSYPFSFPTRPHFTWLIGNKSAISRPTKDSKMQPGRINGPALQIAKLVRNFTTFIVDFSSSASPAHFNRVFLKRAIRGIDSFDYWLVESLSTEWELDAYEIL